LQFVIIIIIIIIIISIKKVPIQVSPSLTVVGELNKINTNDSAHTDNLTASQLPETEAHS